MSRSGSMIETSLISKIVFQTGVYKTHYQKSFKLGVGVQNYDVDFIAAYRKAHDALRQLLSRDCETSATQPKNTS